MVTHKVAELADVSGRHKASGNKIMLEEVSNPFGLFLVNFFSTDSLNIFGMSKDNRTIVFQDAVDREPVLTVDSIQTFLQLCLSSHCNKSFRPFV